MKGAREDDREPFDEPVRVGEEPEPGPRGTKPEREAASSDFRVREVRHELDESGGH